MRPFVPLIAELTRCCVTGFSQAFYRQELFKELGYRTRDDFLEKFWAPLFAHKDALNLRHMLRTWIAADIVSIFPTCDDVFLTLGPAQTCTPGHSWSHDLKNGRSSTAAYIEALGSIKAKVMVTPCRTDLYFPVSLPLA